MYKYDTHVHTSEASRCGKMSGRDMVGFYSELGYDGIIITDHFVNGSTRTTPEMSWREKIDMLFLGYENAKAAGAECGLDVLFGFEYNYEHADFLVYGIDKEWLYAHEDCDKWDFHDFADRVHEDGGFIVHAHPFRQRPYIKHIKLIPDRVDAVEVMNAAHLEDMPFDRRAEWYADEFGLCRTGGSDNHYVNQKYLGGIITKKRLETVGDYVETVRGGALEIFKFENPHFDGERGHGIG